MTQQTEDLLWLILEKSEIGIALLDESTNPIIYNPQFEQLCKNFPEKFRRGNFSIPGALYDKLKYSFTKPKDKGKEIFHISAPDKTAFIFCIEPIQYHAHFYCLISIYSKERKDYDLFLNLRKQYHINDKEFEILRLVKKGFTNKEISQIIDSTEPSIKMFLSRLYQKFDVSNRTEIVWLLEEFINTNM